MWLTDIAMYKIARQQRSTVCIGKHIQYITINYNGKELYIYIYIYTHTLLYTQNL